MLTLSLKDIEYIMKYYEKWKKDYYNSLKNRVILKKFPAILLNNTVLTIKQYLPGLTTEICSSWQ